MNKLKYANYYIGYQEVTNEISLCINISGCPYRCEGCHSKYLWDYTGNYMANDIDNIYNKYKGMITCVCFMGGDQNLLELSELLFKVKYVYKLKTCVYSGSDNANTFDNVIQYLDYLKIGMFIEECGGLKSNTTNQRFFKVNECKLINITDVFQR